MEINRKTLRNVFFGVFGCIFLYWLLHETERVKAVYGFLKGIFSPFVVGAGLAFVLNVPMRGIESWFQMIKSLPLRRALAILLTFVIIFLVLFAVVQLLIPQINDTVETLIERLPVFFDGLVRKAKEFLKENPDLMQWLKDNTELENLNISALVEKMAGVLGDGVTKVVNGAFTAIGNLSSGLFNAVISLVFALYCLCRKEILACQGRRLLYAFLPERICDESIRILRLTNTTFSNFISGQCLEAVILGCLFAIAMLIFRMPYIPLVSVLIAVTALVPIVGAFAGCALGAFFILVNDPMQAVWFVIMFLVLQQFEGNVIYPRVVGQSVGLPGMWVLLAVSLGGELMGVAGMLIMIPLFSVVYTLLREICADRLAKRGISEDKLVGQPAEQHCRLKGFTIRLKRKKTSEEETE